MNFPIESIDKTIQELKTAGFRVKVETVHSRQGDTWYVELAPVFRDENRPSGDSYGWHWGTFEGAVTGAIMAYLYATSRDDNPALGGD